MENGVPEKQALIDDGSKAENWFRSISYALAE